MKVKNMFSVKSVLAISIFLIGSVIHGWAFEINEPSASVGGIYLEGGIGSSLLVGQFGRLERLGRYLELTEDQVSEIKSSVQSEKEERQPLVVQLKENRILLKNMAKGGVFDEDAIKELASQQGELIAELIIIKQRIRTKIANILTPDQHERLEILRNFTGRS